jgi:hypothetical protein
MSQAIQEVHEALDLSKKYDLKSTIDDEEDHDEAGDQLGKLTVRFSNIESVF